MSVNTKQRIGEDIWKLKTEKIVLYLIYKYILINKHENYYYNFIKF